MSVQVRVQGHEPETFLAIFSSRTWAGEEREDGPEPAPRWPWMDDHGMAAPSPAQWTKQKQEDRRALPAPMQKPGGPTRQMPRAGLAVQESSGVS